MYSLSTGRMLLEDYLAAFQADFRRKERVVWARVYLQGLLSDLERKTVEGIARGVTPPDGAEDVRQALQNFLQESPWDEGRVLRRYREGVQARLGPDTVLVVGDIALVKQGRHSVGVHRQFCPEHGRKLNCQIAPAVFALDGATTLPLAARLYLPRAWQEDPGRLDGSKVPPEHRRPGLKSQIALDLLQELRAEGFGFQRVHAGPAYLGSEAFRAAVRDLGYDWLPGGDGAVLAQVDQLVARLKLDFGLDHFEGRTWRGLHHHLCLVILAHGFTHAAEPAARRA
jgi:SRSO17 transposase